jgi:hypothetical protein
MIASNHLVVFAVGEHQHLGGGGEQAEPLDRLDAGEPREFELAEHYVRSDVEHELDRVLAVAGFADDLDPAGGQGLGQRGADQRLGIDHRDRDRCTALTVRLALL